MVAADVAGSRHSIGLGGFEPPTPCPPDKYAKPLRYSPFITIVENVPRGITAVNARGAFLVESA